MDLLIVSGMSGSGKSTAMNALEDLGYFCIDNFPAALLPYISIIRRLTSMLPLRWTFEVWKF